MKEFICIACPRGCHLKVDDNLNVTGNTCIRGAEYGKNEASHPIRIVTSSIRVINREDVVVSIKTVPAIPKEKIFDVMNEINKLNVKAPCRIGDVVLKNILNTGSDIVITKNID